MTPKEAERLYAEAVRLRLSGAELLAEPEAVCRECNGIGAEWMGSFLRGLVTTLNPTLNPVAAIHDRRYAVCKTTEQQKEADDEFRTNGRKSADQYGWWRPRRYVVRRNTEVFYAALRIAGHKAWQSEVEK
jgi:hypothetical protein